MCDNCIKGLEKVTNAFCEKCHGTGILTADLLDNLINTMDEPEIVEAPAVDAEVEATEEAVPEAEETTEVAPEEAAA